MKRKKIWITAVPLLLGLGYLAINPQVAYALLGIPDLVFDPSSYAAIGKIWQQDISNGAKLMQTYNQTVKIVENGLRVYELARVMAQRIQNKSVWREAAFAVGEETTQQHYNETVNFSAVMNGNALNAGRAWQDSTLSAGNAGYLGSVRAANSRRMAEFATIQLLDQTSQRCAQILANYKQTQDANKDAEDKLEKDTYDQSDVKNAEVAVLNVLSGGMIHLRNKNQAAGNLQACLAEQQTLQAKVQRDRLADEQSWYADIARAKASSPVLLDPNATALAIGGSYLEPQMTQALQIKLLAAILAVLVVIAGLLIRGGRPIENPQQSPEEKQFSQKVMPSKKPYLLP